MNTPPAIPGYEIIREQGEGSTAVVWLARQTSLDRDVAIKVLKPEFVTQIEEVDAFLAEARSVAKLKSRHIIQVFDVGQTGNTVYIVMEYVDGLTLAETLQAERRLPPQQAIQVAAAVADAMADAWQSERMIHRDIKPDNIIIETGGGVKLADLGLARIMGQCTEGEIAGTPNYMSPEQARGSARLSDFSDMYSLGATLYHMLTGTPPFVGMPIKDVLQAQQSGQLQPMESFVPGIPRSCKQLVCRLMAKAPKERYPDWSRLRADLLKMADGRLLMIKCPPAGASTLPVPGQPQTASQSSKAIKLQKKANAPTKGTLAIPPRYSVPLALRKTLGYLRVGVVAAFVWFLLGRPLWLAYQGTTSTAEPTQPAAAAPSTPAASDPGTEPDEPPELTTEESDAPEEPLAQPPEEPGIPAGLKRDMVDQLAQGLPGGARQRWEKWTQEHAFSASLPETSALSDLLAPQNQPAALIGKVLMQHTDREFKLQIGGVESKITPKRVQGSMVEAMVRQENGSSTIIRPTTFSLTSLAAEDQLRLLRMSQNRALPYARTILALQQADYASARERADTCGPLSEAVARFAQEKMDRVLQEN